MLPPILVNVVYQTLTVTYVFLPDPVATHDDVLIFGVSGDNLHVWVACYHLLLVTHLLILLEL